MDKPGEGVQYFHLTLKLPTRAHKVAVRVVGPLAVERPLTYRLLNSARIGVSDRFVHFAVYSYP